LKPLKHFVRTQQTAHDHIYIMAHSHSFLPFIPSVEAVMRWHCRPAPCAVSFSSTQSGTDCVRTCA